MLPSSSTLLLAALCFWVASPGRGIAQESEPVHWEHQKLELGSDRVASVVQGLWAPDTCAPTHVVYGWHPYWMGEAWRSYRLDLLSHLSYFSYEVEPSSGSYHTVHQWDTTPLIDSAIAAGVEVTLTVTLFGAHDLFFKNPGSTVTLADSLVALLSRRGGTGVNIDFEGMNASHRESFTRFVQGLSQRMRQELPELEISVDLPAVDWSSVFDIEALDGVVDYFIIMGYGYHWSGSSIAGPVSPRNSGEIWNQYSTTRSVLTWLGAGVARDRLVLGLPWYGREWLTSDVPPPSAVITGGSARTYAQILPRLLQMERSWDDHSSTPWLYSELGDSAVQLWYDDDVSLGEKYDVIRMTGIAGTAIWALGYDGGHPDLWGAVEEAFSSCGGDPCTGYLSDLGGPEGEHPANRTVEFTIAPAGATRLILEFTSLDVGTDSILVWSGGSAGSGTPVVLSGNRSGERILVLDSAATVAFRPGDRAVPGWELTWECSYQPLSVDRNPQSMPARLLLR